MQTLLDQEQFITAVDRIGIYYFHHDILFVSDDVENTLENILTAYQYGGMGREEANGWLAEENLPVTITIDNGLHVAGYDHQFEFTGTVLTNFDGAAHDLGAVLERFAIKVTNDTIYLDSAADQLAETLTQAVQATYGDENGFIRMDGALVATVDVLEAVTVGQLQAQEAIFDYRSELIIPNQSISLRGYRKLIEKAEKEALANLLIEQTEQGFDLKTPFNPVTVITQFKYAQTQVTEYWSFLNHFPNQYLEPWLDGLMGRSILVEDNALAWEEFLKQAVNDITTPVHGDYVSFSIGQFKVKSIHKSVFKYGLKALLSNRLKLWA